MWYVTVLGFSSVLSLFSTMESQMVQNSRRQIGFTFNKFPIKVKRDFNEAQQNQVITFNKFPIKVKIDLNQAQQSQVITFNKFPFKAKRRLNQPQE